MPAAAFRHAVVALTEVDPTFAGRIRRSGVEFVSLRKSPGHGAKVFAAFARLCRQLRPTIVHTRNLAALECQAPAWWAGVPVRIHGEHGRDVDDPRGEVKRYQWMRRAYRPFVHHYVALSRDLGQYLGDKVGVPSARITQIINGVDVERFGALTNSRAALQGMPFTPGQHLIAGTVGRMMTVKAQPVLARAFVRAIELAPVLRPRLRLVMVGDGPLRAEAQAILDAAGLASLAWLPGERADVPDVMRMLDCFVLPSLAEGISNTILEAMATGLPVLATDVGGNAELVVKGESGDIVPAGDVEALANGLVRMAMDPDRAQKMGQAGRERAVSNFSLPAMVSAYQALYDRLLAKHAPHLMNTTRS